MAYLTSLQDRESEREVQMGDQQLEHLSQALHPFRHSLPLMEYRLSRCLDEVLQQFPSTHGHLPCSSSSSTPNTGEASSTHTSPSCSRPFLFLLRRLGALLRQSSLLLKQISPVLPLPPPREVATVVPHAAVGWIGKGELPLHSIATRSPPTFSSSCPPSLSTAAAAVAPRPHEEEQGDPHGEESSLNSRGSSPEPKRCSFSSFPHSHPLAPQQEEEETSKKTKMIPHMMEGKEDEGREDPNRTSLASSSSVRVPFRSSSLPPLFSFVQEAAEKALQMPLAHTLQRLTHNVLRGFAVLDAALREPLSPPLLPLRSPASSSHPLLPVRDIGALAMVKCVPAPASASASPSEGTLAPSCDRSCPSYPTRDRNEREEGKRALKRESATIGNGGKSTAAGAGAPSSRRIRHPRGTIPHEDDNGDDDSFVSSPLPFLLPLGAPATNSEEEKLNPNNKYSRDETISPSRATCRKVVFFPFRGSSHPERLPKSDEIHSKRVVSPPLKEKRTRTSPSFSIEEVEADMWEIRREAEEEGEENGEIVSLVTKTILDERSKAKLEEENGGGGGGTQHSTSTSSPSPLCYANRANGRGGETAIPMRPRRGEQHRFAGHGPFSAAASSSKARGKEERDRKKEEEMKRKKKMTPEKVRKKTEEEEEDAIMSEVHSLVQEMKQRALQMGDWMRGEDREALGKNEALLSAGVQQGEENIKTLSKLSDAYGVGNGGRRPPPAMLSRIPYGGLLWTHCVLPLLDIIKQILFITIVILCTLATICVIWSRPKPSRYSPVPAVPAPSHPSILTTSSSFPSSHYFSASSFLDLAQEANRTIGMAAAHHYPFSLSSTTNNTNQSTFFSTLTHYLMEVSSNCSDASCINPSSG